MRSKSLEKELYQYGQTLGLELVGVDNVHTRERLDEAKTMMDEVSEFLYETMSEGTANQCFDCGIYIVVVLSSERLLARDLAQKTAIH